MSRRRWTDARRRQLLARLHAGDQDVGELAATFNVKLTDFAELADDRTLTAAMGVMCRLERFRLSQFLDRFRVHAIARLIELVNQDDDRELARKASVDLLKLDVGGVDLPDQPVTDGQPQPAAPDAKQVLAMLEQLAEPTPMEGTS